MHKLRKPGSMFPGVHLLLRQRSKNYTIMAVNVHCVCVQALLTTRKGKKRFAMYDLSVTLSWEGLWVEDSNKQVPCAQLLCCSSSLLMYATMSPGMQCLA